MEPGKIMGIGKVLESLFNLIPSICIKRWVVTHASDPTTKQVETEAPVEPVQAIPQAQVPLRHSSSGDAETLQLG